MGVKAKLLAVGLTAGLIGGGAFAAHEYVHESAGSLPAETPEAEPYNESFICAAEYPDCTRDLGAIAILSKGNQIKVAYDAISPNVVNAVVATEDRRFWQHDGIDDKGIARAVANGVVDSLSNQEISLNEGASTLEMQLARNLYVEAKPLDDIKRKKWEWGIALELDKTYPKQKIAEMYLNTVYFGRGAYGVEAASQMYFGVHASELNIVQSATLAAVLKSPDSYDGSNDPDKNAKQRQNLLERRNKVLGDLHEAGAITTEQLNEQMSIPIDGYVLPYQTISVHDNFDVARYIGAEHVVRMIIEDVKKQTGYNDNQLRDGLRINSTISMEAQASASVAAKTAGDYPRDGRQIALVAIGKQGDILALYGGDFAASQVNLITTPSPTGSADKPWFYTNWLNSGLITPDQLFTEPDTFVWEGGGENKSDYVVATGDHCRNKQACGLPEAIAVSSNMIPLQIAEDHPETLQTTRDLMKEFGIYSDTPAVPSNILGSTEATPLSRTIAYAGLLANKGAALEAPILIWSISKADESGKIQRLFDTKHSTPKQIVTTKTADTILDFLRGVPRRGGTAGKKLNDIPTDIAGKTGTFDSNMEAGIFLTACLVNPTNKQNENITYGVIERYVDKLAPLGKGQVGGNVPAAVYKQAIQKLLPAQSCSL